MVKISQEQIENPGSDDSGNIVIDESSLTAKAKSGDLGATQRLVMLYQDRIYNAVLKICGNRDDAAELTQDAFVKALSGLGSFRAQSSFYTWLFRIAINNTLNFCKRNSKVKFESLDAEDAEQGKGQLRRFLADRSSPDPELDAMSREMSQLVNSALCQLSPEHKAVIVLRDIEQLSYEQISEILDLELGTVKSRIARGRGNLKQILEAMSE